jgi:6-pyruvoyltetrahydropterin/6-carboxytetrahydropterin synthase
MAAVVEITRRAAFSSSHRLHSTQLTDEENAEIFGKCNWPGGHGHNYVLTVTVEGPVDPKNGMVMNLTVLARIMDEAVVRVLDHRNIDRDVPAFCAADNSDGHALVSTAENVAVWAWERLSEHKELPAGLLKEVRLEETEKNSVVYRGVRR